MNVFRLKADANRYQNLCLKSEEDWDLLDGEFCGTQFNKRFTRLAVKILKKSPRGKKLLKGDFPSMAAHLAVFSATAATALGPILQGNGELIPIPCEGQNLVGFNVLKIVDALDLDHSKLQLFPSTGRIMRVIDYEFYSEKMGELTIFKIPQTIRSEILVTDRFVEVAEANKLRGFKFDELWSN
jgi:hypothetical protein